MKLKKLKMKAFGPYTDETVVDFDQINSGLYLIQGKTGAGKTMIFDAIVFALFGKSSGGKRELAMMHSDFVGKDVPTEIELFFEHNGGEHRVKRTLKFTRHHGGTYDDKTVESHEFEECGRAVISGKKKVDSRIGELLGLDASQFGQIVMLAQGDFKKFLEADSGDRAEILKRIFDTSKYKGLQDRLKKAKEILASGRTEDEESRRLELQNMVLPDDLSEEMRNRIKPVDPARPERVLFSPVSIGALAELIVDEEHRADAADAVLDKAKREQVRAVQARAEAEARNGRLDALDAAKAKKAEFDALQADYAEKEQLIQVAQRVLVVRRADEGLGAAKAEIAVAEACKSKAEEALEKAKADEKTASDANKACDLDRVTIGELDIEINRLQESLPRYGELTRIENELAARQKEYAATEKIRDGKGDEARRCADSLDEISRALESLSTAEADVPIAEAALGKAEEVLKNFQQVRKDVLKAEKGSVALETLRKSLEVETRETLRKKEEYDGLYALFIRGQAGLMAGALADEIARSGSGTCPVCGMVHTAVGGGFAKVAADTPTEAQVEAAKEAFDNAEEKRSSLSLQLSADGAALTQQKDALVASVRLFKGCEAFGWDALADIHGMCEKENEFLIMREEASKAAKMANDALTRKNALFDEKRKHEAAQGSAEEAVRKAEDQLNELRVAEASLKTKVDELRGQLAFMSEAAAKDELQKKTDRKSALQEKIESAEKVFNKAGKARAAADEAVKLAVKTLGEKKDLAEKSAREFQSVLLEQGYADEGSYSRESAFVPQKDAPGWLNELSAECATYRNNCLHNGEAISSLEAETAGYVRANLEELEVRCREAEAAEEAAGKASQQVHRFVDLHVGAKKRIEKLSAKLRSSDAAMDRLDALSSLANGDRGSGTDRLDFERFMLGASLCEVLDQANVRLDKMSGGKFELVHRAEGANRQSASGLDIDVVDHMTGVQRQAGTFSGGEGFMASMALALGLADVVRNHAGNIRLDSTFIDEGFGSLDDDKLEKCLEVLKELASGNRQVGIISHVSKLEEDVWPQIIVTKDEKGSSVRLDKGGI